MANIVISILLVGILLIILGVLQNLVSSMIPELEGVLDYPPWVISILLSVPAIIACSMIFVMSFIFSKVTLRQCIRISAIIIALSMGASALGLISDHKYVSIGFAALGRFLFGTGWVPLQMSLSMLLRHRFARSHMYVRNSLWNILINFTFVGMIVAYMFTPAIMEMSIHFMALVLGGMIVAVIVAAMLLPSLFAEYLNVKTNITTLNPPQPSVLHIIVIALHNFLTTGLWMGLLLYLPSIIVEWNTTIKIVDFSTFSMFIAMGVFLSFFVSLYVTTKRRWLINIGSSTLIVVVGCVLALLDYEEPMLGIALVIVAASSFYMTPFIASNALFVGSTLNIAYQWIFASTFLGMSVFPLLFSLMSMADPSSTLAIVVCLIVFIVSSVLAYMISVFLEGTTDEEFASANLNFIEVIAETFPTKMKGEIEESVDSEAGSSVFDESEK